VTDRIDIVLQPHPDLELAVRGFGDYIKSEVLGNTITFTEISNGEELVFDEVESRLSVTKA
jgi:isoleucyl-tRNA synthetase